MADETIGIDIILNAGEAATSVKELRQSIKDLQGAALKAGAEGNEALANKFAKAAGQAKDRMADLKDQVNAFGDTGSKIGAVTGFARTLAGGFAAAQGAAALFGSTSKDLEKTLLKVQGALALSQGISELAQAGEQFKIMKAVAIDAMKGIKAAIGSTGIGLLVVALGTIVAYWDDIKGLVSGVTSEQKKLNEEADKNATAEEKKLKALNASDNILKLQGKTEKEILQIKIAQEDAMIAAQKRQIEMNITTLQAQIEAEKRNKEILEGLVNFISLPITALLRTIDMVGLALGKNFNLMGQFQDMTANLVFDPAKVKKEGEAAIEEQKQKLLELQNTQAGHKVAIKKIDDDAATKSAEEKKKADTTAEEERKKAAELELKLRGELAQSIVNSIADEREKEIANAQLSFRNRLDAIVGDGATETALRAQIKEEQRVAMLALDTKFEQEDAAKKLAADEKKKADDLKTAADDKKKAEEKIANEKKVRDAKIEMAQQALNGLTALAKLSGIQGQAAINLNKALAVVQIGIDTAKGISSAVAAGAGIPFPGNIPAIITGVSAVLSGIVAAKAALSDTGVSAPSTPSPSFDTGAGGGTSAPLTPTSSNVGNTSTTISESGQVVAPMVVKAYVVESEMTQSQLHVKSIVDKSQFP
ncbi:hypothetical protein UFOVP1624_13 [uncultured Caudovirales phage]|uniref:Uncharacterized protein n=1 Tax=uncultured Caudovirales phage TaxID=2100421 RepID=A0A6J5SWK9_9CAUD|nr:hypothetical protein UFOVP1624_13 [uncultured Caudovirales phage]